MIARTSIISYLKAGYLLHLMALFEIILLSYLFYQMDIDQWITDGNFFLRSAMLIPFALLPLLAQLDARSRYQNYKQLKDLLYRKGFQPRILKPFSKTRCQRCAAFVAAQELGMGENCKKYFYHLGYRWFHFFPDFIFSDPRYLICKDFWINTFFAKSYKSRVNFKLIKKIRMGGLR